MPAVSVRNSLQASSLARCTRPRGAHALLLSGPTLLLSLAIACATTVGRAADGVDRWLRELHDPRPFVSERAAAEIRKLGDDAIEPVARALEKAEGSRWRRLESVAEELLGRFLEHLESEYRALRLDRFELEDLRLQAKQLEELRALRVNVEAWSREIPDFVEKASQILRWRAIEALQARNGTISASDRENLESLREDARAAIQAHPGIEARAAAYARLAALESISDRLVQSLSEVNVLRAEDLEARVREREPRVDAILTRLDAIGLIAYGALAARRERIPLSETLDTPDLRPLVVTFYDGLLVAQLDALLATSPERVFPPPESFSASRTLLAAFWALEIDRGGAHTERARAALDRHLAMTVDDLVTGDAGARERALIELFRLGKHGRRALDANAERIGTSAAFLSGLLRWRVHPETYASVGMEFREFPSLSFPERRRQIFEYARAAGAAAIPTLRAIVDDESLEPSPLVKHAAAKALLSTLGDRAGYLVLQRRYPALVLERPEISRDLFLLQALAFVQAKEYRKAIEELAKILEKFPFDFDANYHTAFAHLLLKEFARAIHFFEIARRVHPGDQLTLYNLACAYSLAGRLDKALDALEASVVAGFDDPDHMEKDPDLAPLRDDPSAEARYREIRAKCADAAAKSA